MFENRNSFLFLKLPPQKKQIGEHQPLKVRTYKNINTEFLNHQNS